MRAARGIPRKRKKLPARIARSILAVQLAQCIPMCNYHLQRAIDVEMLPIENNLVILLGYGLLV
jgi:hypothetical protein